MKINRKVIQSKHGVGRRNNERFLTTYHSINAEMELGRLLEEGLNKEYIAILQAAAALIPKTELEIKVEEIKKEIGL